MYKFTNVNSIITDNDKDGLTYFVNILNGLEERYRVRNIDDLDEALIFKDMVLSINNEPHNSAYREQFELVATLTTDYEIQRIFSNQNSLLTVLMLKFTNVKDQEDIDIFNNLLKKTIFDDIKNRMILSYIALLFLKIFNVLIQYNKTKKEDKERTYYDFHFLLHILNEIYKDLNPTMLKIS